LFYNQTNFDAGNFTIATFRGNSQVFNALFPQTYGGDLMIHAICQYRVQVQKNLVVLGLRGEAITKKVAWNTIRSDRRR
jgi:hypothetical protein